MAEPHGLRCGGKPYRLLKHLLCCEVARFGLNEADAQIFDLGALSRLSELGYILSDRPALTAKGDQHARPRNNPHTALCKHRRS